MRFITINKVLGGSLILMLLLTACSKKRLIDDPVVEEDLVVQQAPFESGSLDALYTEFEPETQVFVIDTGDSGMIIGQQGTIIGGFYDTAITTASGNAVDLPIELHMIEVYHPWEMIFGKIPTTTTSSYLSAVGEVKIQLKKDGEELKLSNGGFYNMEVQAKGMTGDRSLYYTDANGDLTNWYEETVSSVSLGDTSVDLNSVERLDTTYLLTSTFLGWNGCSSEPTMDNAASLAFKSDSIPFSAMDLFVVNRTLNSTIPVEDSTSVAISGGETINVVAFAIDVGGQYYLVNEELVTPSVGDVNLKFGKVTKQELVDALKAL